MPVRLGTWVRVRVRVGDALRVRVCMAESDSVEERLWVMELLQLQLRLSVAVKL